MNRFNIPTFLVILFFLGIIHPSISAQTLPSYVPTNGLVGWWPFNGNANDENGNGNHAALMNGANLTTDRLGNLSSACNLNSNPQYLSFPSGSSSNLNIIADFSVSIWIKTSVTISNGGLVSFGDNVSAPPTAGGYLSCINGGNTGSGRFGISTRGNWYPSNSLVNNNQWNNIISIYKNGVINIYINGILDATFSSVLSPLSWSGNRVFGARSDLFMNSNTNYIGQLDDIGIWNRALDSCEVRNLYQASINPCCPATITSNTLSPSQTICGTSTPATFTGSTPSGGNGVFTYSWESSSNQSTWTSITGATARDYTPAVLNANTYFRRVVSSGACPGSTSAVVSVQVASVSFTATADTICQGQSVTLTANTNLSGNNQSPCTLSGLPTNL